MGSFGAWLTRNVSLGVCHPGEVKRVKTLSLQETGQRADSVHPVERLCSFYHLDIHRHSRERAGMGECGGSAVGAKYIVRGSKDTTQTVLNINGAQGFCPWSRVPFYFINFLPTSLLYIYILLHDYNARVGDQRRGRRRRRLCPATIREFLLDFWLTASPASTPCCT